jgi:hypothetical protein
MRAPSRKVLKVAADRTRVSKVDGNPYLYGARARRRRVAAITGLASKR